MTTFKLMPQDCSLEPHEPKGRCVARMLEAARWRQCLDGGARTYGRRDLILFLLTFLFALSGDVNAGESTNTNDKALLLNPEGAKTLQWVTLPLSRESDFDFPGQFTVEFWLSFADWPRNKVSLVSKGSDAWAISLMPSGKIGFQTGGVSEGTNGPTELLSSISLERSPQNGPTNWYHVAVTYDPLLRRKSLYLNGARDAVSESLEGNLRNNNLPVRFGASALASTNQTKVSAEAYQGKLDEIRLWRTARSEDRIRESYTRLLQGTEPGLIGVWSFNTNTIASNGSTNLFHPSSGDITLAGSFEGTLQSINLAVGQDLKVAAPRQYSYFFNGSQDFVSVPHHISLNVQNQAIFEAWVKPSSLFLASDLSNADGFIRRLTNSSDANTLLGKFVWNQFSQQNRQSLLAFGTPLATRTHILMNELNRLIQGPSIYQADRFTPVTLRPETDKLTKTTPIGSDLIGFNRMLLEDAYRNELVPLSTRRLTVFAKGVPGYGLVVDGTGSFQFHYGGVWSAAIHAEPKVPFDRWSHIGVGFFRPNMTAGATITLYRDGLLVGGSTNVTIPAAFANTRELTIGASVLTTTNIPSNYFRGELDEVRLWNTRRTDTEIALFASREVPAAPTNLVSYWKFDEGKGMTLIDNTRNGRTGTFSQGGGLGWAEGMPLASPLPTDLKLTANKDSRGLWIGQVNLTAVNEVHARNQNDAETLRATPDNAAASFRILFHVDTGGQVRLLKDVVIIGVTNGTSINTILVTDLKWLNSLGSASGVVRRGGKMVPMRHGSAAFDFPGFELPFAGGVGVNLGCLGRITLPALQPTNPFRHRFHPEHRSGYDLTREISIRFNGSNPGLDAPGFGVDRLTGTYEETVIGLHKVPIKVKGELVLNRISEAGILNQIP